MPYPQSFFQYPPVNQERDRVLELSSRFLSDHIHTWTLAKTRLFFQTNTDIGYATSPTVEVHSLIWDVENLFQICAYCGHQRKPDADECPGCSARLPKNIFSAGLGSFTVEDIFPHASWLIYPPVTMAVAHITCGALNTLKNADALIWLLDCQVKERVIPDLTSRCDNAELSMLVKFSCRVVFEFIEPEYPLDSQPGSTV